MQNFDSLIADASANHIENIENILKGKVWNKVIRAHKLTLEALWTILWPKFVLWAQENEKELGSKLKETAGSVIEGFSKDDDDHIESGLALFIEEIAPLSTLLDEFDVHYKEQTTFILPQFFCDLPVLFRDGDWTLYLSSFAEMLPWFALFDHVHYTRWGVIFLADMKML